MTQKSDGRAKFCNEESGNAMAGKGVAKRRKAMDTLRGEMIYNGTVKKRAVLSSSGTVSNRKAMAEQRDE